MKHKHFNIIQEWIKDTSRKVECRHPNGKWVLLWDQPSWSEDMEFRFADSVLRYRVALFEDGGAGRWTAIANNAQDEEDLCQAPYFVRWITDWTEVTDPPVEEPKPKTLKCVRWLNLLNNGTVGAYATPADAETYACLDRAECRRIEWEVPA